jgi:alpha-ketoglutarate-dependent taurine dioxygenase
VSNPPTTGLEMHGISGHDFIDPSVAARCLDDMKAHGVVVYRDACIGDADLVAFSRLLGEVVIAPMGGLPDYPQISPVTLDPARSELARYRQSTFFWHIDGTTDTVPQKATLLAAREIAEVGGDTEFANTYHAYEALDEPRKTELANIRVVHSFASSQLLAYPDPTPKEREAWEHVAPQEHPLVWTRDDGRRSLLLGATAGEVVGVEPEEGRAVLEGLLDWCTQPRFVLRHEWKAGDLVVWDNTGLLHRALPYEPTSRRLLHRTTLVGDLAVS